MRLNHGNGGTDAFRHCARLGIGDDRLCQWQVATHWGIGGPGRRVCPRSDLMEKQGLGRPR